MENNKSMEKVKQSKTNSKKKETCNSRISRKGKKY